MSVIAIIPAQGTSAPIPGKNLVTVGGKPLLAWTIEAAIDTWSVDYVFVSTEDKEIASCARRFGAEVIERPLELVGDGVTSEQVMLHSLDWLWEVCGIRADYLALLQCTSPLRCSAIIDRAVSMALETGCDAVVSVHETTEYFFTGDLVEDRLVLGYDPRTRPRRQDIPPKYRENGSTYVTKTDFLRSTGCRMGGDTRAIVMTPIEGLDIDHIHNLMIARHYLENHRHTTNGYARLPLMR